MPETPDTLKPASPDTCGEAAGSLAGCRRHVDAGEHYCGPCRASWRATYTRHTYPNWPRDEHGPLPNQRR